MVARRRWSRCLVAAASPARGLLGSTAVVAVPDSSSIRCPQAGSTPGFSGRLCRWSLVDFLHGSHRGRARHRRVGAARSREAGGPTRTGPRPTCCRPRRPGASMHSTDSLDEAARYVDHGDTGAAGGRPRCSVGGGVLCRRVRGRGRRADRARQVPDRTGTRRCGTASHGSGAGCVKGDLQAWRARRIADRTLLLSPEAAAYVDQYVAHCAHKIGLAALERLIDEAIARFMPALAEEQRRRPRTGAASRSTPATSPWPAPPGSTASSTSPTPLTSTPPCPTSPRSSATSAPPSPWTSARATAVGEIARHQLALDLVSDSVVEEVAQQPSRNHRTRKTRKQVVPPPPPATRRGGRRRPRATSRTPTHSRPWRRSAPGAATVTPTSR